MQVDILHGRPDDGQATHLSCEHANLIGVLPHVAKETFNGIGGLNVSVHGLREGIASTSMRKGKASSLSPSR